jgi:predicted permease
VVVEIALSSALLTTAGLVIRSGSMLGSGDVGVSTAGFLTARVKLPYNNFDHQWAFIRGLVARLRVIPGIEAATVTAEPPGIDAHWRPMYQLPDRAGARPQELPSASLIQVAPGFFETFRIPIVQGRAFLDSDNDPRTSVVVVSEAMARATWPGESPIGKVMRIAPEETWVPPVRVVGVARDVRYDQQLRSLGRTPPTMYVPITQWPSPEAFVALSNPRDPQRAAEEVRRAVRELEREAPLSSFRTLDEERRRNTAGLILIGRMFEMFGVVALALAASGVYAVVSYSVAQRTREVAIRRALGAPGGRVLAVVLARSCWQLLLGLALGMVLAPGMGAVLGTVVGQPDSPLPIYVEVAGVLSVALLLSIVLPLRRALTLEPSAVLRHG